MRAIELFAGAGGAALGLEAAGIDLIHADCDRCIALMERLQNEKPDLWAEDIGH